MASPAFASEFKVDGDKGWEVPSDNPDMYNEWASKNRFNVGDIVRFKYENDSVMVVTEDEYNRCKSSHPAFFSNNGDTEYKLAKSGTFYFISGVSDHCDRGQKMIIKVITPAPPPSDSSNAVALSTQAIAGMLVTCVFNCGLLGLC